MARPGAYLCCKLGKNLVHAFDGAAVGLEHGFRLLVAVLVRRQVDEERFTGSEAKWSFGNVFDYKVASGDVDNLTFGDCAEVYVQIAL